MNHFLNIFLSNFTRPIDTDFIQSLGSIKNLFGLSDTDFSTLSKNPFYNKLTSKEPMNLYDLLIFRLVVNLNNIYKIKKNSTQKNRKDSFNPWNSLGWKNLQSPLPRNDLNFYLKEQDNIFSILKEYKNNFVIDHTPKTFTRAVMGKDVVENSISITAFLLLNDNIKEDNKEILSSFITEFNAQYINCSLINQIYLNSFSKYQQKIINLCPLDILEASFLDNNYLWNTQVISKLISYNKSTKYYSSILNIIALYDLLNPSLSKKNFTNSNYHDDFTSSVNSFLNSIPKDFKFSTALNLTSESAFQIYSKIIPTNFLDIVYNIFSNIKSNLDFRNIVPAKKYCDDKFLIALIQKIKNSKESIAKKRSMFLKTIELYSPFFTKDSIFELLKADNSLYSHCNHLANRIYLNNSLPAEHKNKQSLKI